MQAGRYVNLVFVITSLIFSEFEIILDLIYKEIYAEKYSINSSN